MGKPSDASSIDIDSRKELQIKADNSNNDRGEWGNHCEFFLSSLGLAVGLGNIWRFPYVAYSNGGATFLIPYFLMLLVVGLPVFFLEMSLGQYAGLSATKIFARLTPGVRGYGYGQIVIPNLINIQYVVIMAYALFYMFTGFNSTLPWSLCTHDYNTDRCFSLSQYNAECNATSDYYYQKQCMNGTTFCPIVNATWDEQNITSCITEDGNITSFFDMTLRVPSSEEYWYHRVLNIAVENGHLDTSINSWSKWGKLRWDILGCLFLSWTLICLSLIQGIQSYGKVVYFTALFPYVVLTISLGYVATLDGFSDGVEFYIVPKDWSKLLSASIWNDAAGQIFYSLGAGTGGQLLLASYNKFTSNTHRDALLIGFCNSMTSLYAGFTVFGVIGFLAKQKQMDIDEVVTQGPGLAFIVYPEAVSMMEASPPFFSFLFFFMLVLLAISSVCGSWESLIAAFLDEFPQFRKKRPMVMIVSCFLAFLGGISMCFDSGFLMFTLMDSRCGNAIILMGLIELILVCWFYGADRLLSHIEDMGMKLPNVMKTIWWSCWVLIDPILLFFVTILVWVNYPGDSLEDYEYPPPAEFLGWMLELVGVFVVVLFSVYVFIKRAYAKKTLAYLRVGPLMTPTAQWGPRTDSGLPLDSWKGGYENNGFEEED